MIQPFLSHLAFHRNIVLASKSPRRKRVLEQIKLVFDAVPSPVQQFLDLTDISSPGDLVMQSAKEKALSVTEFIKRFEYHADLVIGADTVVILEGEVFDLPKNKAEARRMIERLNGKTHEVFSGVALVLPRYENGVENHQVETFYEMTKVTFGNIPPDVIEAYFATTKPWANVGGYAIERVGGTFVESIEGDYYTAVGFPVHKFCKEIYRMCSEGLL